MSFWKSLFGSKDQPPRRTHPLSRDEALAALYHSVQTRPRPEDVAELILEVLPLIERARPLS
jgi:hypothetical protein